MHDAPDHGSPWQHHRSRRMDYRRRQPIHARVVVYRQMVDDTTATVATGPGGHRGTSTSSSVTSLHPHTGSSEKSLPGPVGIQPNHNPGGPHPTRCPMAAFFTEHDRSGICRAAPSGQAAHVSARPGGDPVRGPVRALGRPWLRQTEPLDADRVGRAAAARPVTPVAQGRSAPQQSCQSALGRPAQAARR